MKRAIIITAILLPPLLMVVLLLLPQLNGTFEVPIFHFYIVTFFSFTSAVVALLFATVLDERSLYRHRLLVTAFASMAALFFIHGTTTNGALILEFNPGIRWAAWLTLFVGGLLFALAGFDRPITPLQPKHYRAINWTVAVFCLFFMGVVYLKPEWLTAIDEAASPFHAQLVFWLTLIMWIYAAIRFARIWRETRNQVDGIMALIAIWLTWATVSMHQFPTWQLSWWLYHVLLLGSALLAFVALINQYEQIRYFRPTWYYFAIGLVVTALMTLLTSYLLSRVVERRFLAASNYQEAMVQARVVGLSIAAVSLGALFFTLLIVVRRAEKLLGERTDELAVAYQNLQASETLRADLADMIVHDLRSPLTGINLSIDMLAESFKDPQKASFQDRFISNARSSIQRMLNLINQLLDMTRLEAGQLDLNRSSVMVNDLLNARAKAYAVQSEVNSVTLVVEPADESPVVYADANFINRVLDNLIDNALKFTGSGGTVSLLAQPNGTDVVIQVRDTGEGIPEEELNDIFEKYAQVKDRKGKEDRRGTGLGLTFCKLVVEAHNGRIWVESKVGIGSTFSFTLPISQN
ncbi:MAG: ATP-binding protein [Candidatus Promineifilaceae bacterium]